jgi:two-component system, OmpR family, sensor kinase
MGFRAKLIISYALIVLVTLMGASGLFAYVAGQIQAEQTEKTVKRLQSVTNLIGNELLLEARRTQNFADYEEQLQKYAVIVGVRIMLVDNSGRVRIDTEIATKNVEGQTIPSYKIVPRDKKVHGEYKTTLRNVDYIYYAYAGPGLDPTIARNSDRADRISFQPNDTIQTDLWIAMPEIQIRGGWNSFITGMALAGAFIFGLAVLIAIVVGRSISRPLVRMTRASTAIAQGNYTQQIPVQGGDELGKLAMSFNTMAREVARSQQTMRDFVANVSHELKTPLTSIQGFSQAISEGVADDPDTIKHSSDVIYSEAARMRRLVDELLDLSRMESGQIVLNKKAMDLSILLVNVLDKLEPLANSRDLKIQVRRNDRTLVTGDADRLEQVFTNLVDNAIKYGQAGSTIWLDVQAMTENDLRVARIHRAPYATVQIANLGPVIPNEQLPRIFERFYKLDRSRQRKGESTGLGLAIVRELVEAHHGTIKVSSNPLPDDQSTGYTIFTVEIPLCPTNAVVKTGM